MDNTQTVDKHLIQVRNADIFQEHFCVLEDVNFSIEKGEFVYLVGRTGSGKSSLLKTLYADLPLEKGTIEITGYNIEKIKSKEIPFLRRKIGIIFQDFQLFFDRTVSENLEFVLKATGWTNRAQIKIRISSVLMRVGLESAQGKMPHQLSGGEQQRIVIARALLNEPSILLADEPTGNLDPEVGDSIMELFRDINHAGTTILMATHNHSLFDKFPGRILACKQNKLIEIKSTAELKV